MPTNRETGKDRWKRVPKDYFKKPDRLQRTRLRLSLLALVLSLGYVAAGLGRSGGRDGSSTDGNSLRANHGDLARVHAAWENRCEACHVPFEPIDGRGLLASATTAPGRSGDTLCMSCHAGPAHHAAAIPSEVKACAGCHRDHQGRDFSMVRLDDNECTGCHSALHAHTNVDVKPKGGREYMVRILAFDSGNHPPFRSEHADYADPSAPVDRGKLKFNHARHMSPGIIRQPGDRPYTVGDIPVASEQPRYGKTATEAVRLGCASCHLLDAGGRPASASSRSPGKYYQPVNYQGQCRACHPLTYDPRAPGLEAPHGVEPGEVSIFIRRAYASQILSDDPRLLDDFRPKVSLPGKAPREIAARKKLDDAVASAEQFMFSEGKNNCKECHEYAGGIDRGVVPARIEPTNVPEVWYSHATFDHTAHRAWSCRECHAGAEASTTRADVIVPGMDNCVKCHIPARSDSGWSSRSAGTTGVASANCTECHRYHDGDRPMQSAGARARGATSERSVAEFFAGSSRIKPTVAP